MIGVSISLSLSSRLVVINPTLLHTNGQSTTKEREEIGGRDVRFAALMERTERERERDRWMIKLTRPKEKERFRERVKSRSIFLSPRALLPRLVSEVSTF